MAEVLVGYRDTKNKRGLLDFDDLLTRCTDVLEHDATMAAAVRWRVRHLFVDEFQDANPAQWRLLMAWLGDRDDLFVVGDPAQAVYSWNGADPDLLDRMPDFAPRYDGDRAGREPPVVAPGGTRRVCRAGIAHGAHIATRRSRTRGAFLCG